ncbi:MAG: hypothetical protein MK108_06580 [Mariniblastus sp.]|nr:hypothetical protein [Mariniblastus sp.]
MFHRISLQRFTGLFTVVAILSCLAPQAMAQNDVAPGLSGSFSIDRPFLDDDGSIVVEGQLKGLEGATAIIKVKGKEMRFNLNQFSSKEQQWIRQQIAIEKKRKSKWSEINKLATGLASNKPTIIAKTCNRLKTYGPAASHIAPQLDPHIASSDSRTSSAAFVCLVSIAEDTPVAIRRIVDQFKRNPSLADRFASNPSKALKPFSRFGSRGLPYLGAVAFSGQLNVAAAERSEIEAQTELDKQATKTRVAACRAIARSDGEEEAANLLLEVLEAEVTSDAEENQAGEVFECLGTLGFQSDLVLEAIQEHAAEDPEQAKLALQEISEANQDD